MLPVSDDTISFQKIGSNVRLRNVRSNSRKKKVIYDTVSYYYFLV